MAQTLTFTNAIATFGLNSVSNSTYATAHASAASNSNTNNNDATAGVGNNYDGANYFFRRFFFHFDTSSIPSGALIRSAFLRLPGTNTSNNNTNTDTIGIYQSTVSTDTSIATSDWTNFGATLFGSLAMASYNNAANNDISLNASGIAVISFTGYTKLMIMTTQDHAATVPTGMNNQTFNATGLLLSVTFDAGHTLSTGKYW